MYLLVSQIYSTTLVGDKGPEDTTKEDDPSSGYGSAASSDIVNEIAIIRQQMRHPNIVRYRKIFIESKGRF